MTAALCPSNNCDGYVQMCNADNNDIAKCEKCNKQLDEEAINRYFEVTELNETNISNMHSLNCILSKLC